MVSKKHKIVWSSFAIKDFRKAIQYISKDSKANSVKVRKDIYKAVGELYENPTRYPAVKYRVDNDTNYRAFELHHFRISYLITDSEIQIIRFRHTGRQPVGY